MRKPLTKHIAIILAAGKGLRMQGVDKIETIVDGKPLVAHTIAPFLASKYITDIIIACNDENIVALKKIFPVVKVSGKVSKKSQPNIHFAIGGETRFQSAKNAFMYGEKNLKPTKKSTILYHNSGNVLVTTQEIDDTIRTAISHGACIVARPASDTLKKIDAKNPEIISTTIDRKEILYAETPQTFRYDIIKNAYTQPIETTDESSLVEAAKCDVHWILASTFNRKITTQHDLEMTKMIIEKNNKTPRYGIASDAHFFEKNTRATLRICGITIKNIPKLSADSDGDVAIHAITTALSQAIGGGSLGTFATAMCKKGVKNSAKYLEKILQDMKKRKFTITHLGLHFECKRPPIDALVPQFKKSLGALLRLQPEEIGITASSGKMKDDGIHCTAIVTVF